MGTRAKQESGVLRISRWAIGKVKNNGEDEQDAIREAVAPDQNSTCTSEGLHMLATAMYK